MIAELEIAQIWQATQIFEPVTTLNALMSVKKSLSHGKMQFFVQTDQIFKCVKAVSGAHLTRYFRQFSTDLFFWKGFTVSYKFILFIIEPLTSKIHQVKKVVP